MSVLSSSLDHVLPQVADQAKERPASPSAASALPHAMPRVDDRPLWDVLLGVFGLPVVMISHRLDLFERIHAKPPTFAELCEEMKLSRRTAQILVSTAMALGFLHLHDDGRYRLTALSEDYLLKASPTYFGHYWDLLIDNRDVFSFDALQSAITDDAPKAYGVSDIYRSHREEAERARTFTRAMHAISVPPGNAWSSKLDLSGHRHMLDIGGGSGAHALMAVSNVPTLKATIFDLPTVCPVAEEFIARYGLGERVKTHPGDMWTDPFPPADLHFYSHVYHGWRPEKCRFLSAKSFDALPPGGRIVVHEAIYDDADKTGPFTTAAFSMLMLGWGEGEQYSGEEIRSFLEEAGFVDIEIVPTFSYFSVVTGRKA